MCSKAVLRLWSPGCADEHASLTSVHGILRLFTRKFKAVNKEICAGTLPNW